MEEFKMYIEGLNGKGAPETVSGWGVEDAVERFVERNWLALRYPSEVAVVVLLSTSYSRYLVKVTTHPRFDAIRL